MFKLSIFILIVLLSSSTLGQKPDALNNYFLKLKTTTGIDALGFTYFSVNRNESGTNAFNFTSFYHGSCSSSSGTKIPASSNSLWRIASVSKIYVSTAIMQLIDQGKLSLNDHASQYIPELSGILKSSPSGQEPTILDYLQHRIGLEDRIFGLLTKNMNLSESETFYFQSTFTRYMGNPGDAIAYSNAGVLLLGAVVEKISQKPLVTYLREMLAPIFLEQGKRIEDVKFGFTNDINNSGFFKDLCISSNSSSSSYEPYTVTSKSAGDVIASTEDVARFMAAHLVNSSAIFKKPETFEISRTLEGNGKLFRGGFAKLWEIINYKGVHIVTKGGNIPGFNTYAWFVPSLNEGGVLTSSGDFVPSVIDVTNLIVQLHPEISNQASIRSKFAQIPNDDKLKSSISKIPSHLLSRRSSPTGVSKIASLLGVTGAVVVVAPSSFANATIDVLAFGSRLSFKAVEVPGLDENTLAFVNTEDEPILAPFLTVRYSGPVFSSDSFVQRITLGEIFTAFPMAGLDAILLVFIFLAMEEFSIIFAIGLGIAALVCIIRRRKHSESVETTEADEKNDEADNETPSTNALPIPLVLNILDSVTMTVSVSSLILMLIFGIIAGSITVSIIFGQTTIFILLGIALILYTSFSILLLCMFAWLISQEVYRKTLRKVWIGFMVVFGIFLILGTIEIINLNLMSFRFW
ncbi:hypothetical protein HK098_000617 [Nowakowskiella sp. JEL0407]|nr:hypothetical protein HK098_000617 [Nowakowskiella sp. JEL0407]